MESTRTTSNMPKASSSAKAGNKPTKSTSQASTPKNTSASTSSKSSPKLYSSFVPIPLSIPSPVPIPSSSSKSLTHTTHYIYVRPHKAVKEASIFDSQDGEGSSADENGRKVFVANLPVDITERDLRIVFGRWGVIESIDFTGLGDGDTLAKAVLDLQADDSDSDDQEDDIADQGDDEAGGDQRAEPTFTGTSKPYLPRRLRPRKKPVLPPSVPTITPLPPLCPRATPYGSSGTRCCHITFLDSVAVSNVMSHPTSSVISLAQYGGPPSSSSKAQSNPSGLQYYLNLHTSLRPDLGDVKEFADSSMARFDHLQSMLLSSRAKKTGAGALVDEDGFTVVVRGGRYGRTGGRGKGVAGVGVASRGFAKGALDEPKKGGAAELEGFYKFQKVEKKRKGESRRCPCWCTADL